jgi:hypothetical protein
VQDEAEERVDDKSSSPSSSSSSCCRLRRLLDESVLFRLAVTLTSFLVASFLVDDEKDNESSKSAVAVFDRCLILGVLPPMLPLALALALSLLQAES